MTDLKRAPAGYYEIKPAKARSMRRDRVVELADEAGWIAETKEDGWRFLMHFGGELDRVYMTGRRESVRTLGLSEKGLCAPCLWPRESLRETLGYTILDGEVKPPPGVRREVLASIMNVSPEDAEKKIAEVGQPSYVSWDVLFDNGVDVRYESLFARRDRLRSLVERLDHPLISLVRSSDEPMALYDEIVGAGGEGIVLKDLSSLYDEKNSWVKLKKSPTCDVIVTGWKAGKGKYEGQIGSVRVSVYGSDGKTLIEVAKVSGMDDDVRRDMSEHPERWLGTVIEIEAQEFSRDRLLSPNYKRRREDADPKSCTFQKLLYDLASGERKLDPEQLKLF